MKSLRLVKKFFLPISILPLLFNPLYASTYIGVSLGLNISPGDHDTGEYAHVPSSNIFIAMEIGASQVKTPRLAFSSGVRYSQKGVKTDKPFNWQCISEHLDLIARLKYYPLNPELYITPFISGGPYISYLVKYFGLDYKECDLGFHFEIGADFGFPVDRYGFGIEFGYSADALTIWGGWLNPITWTDEDGNIVEISNYSLDLPSRHL